MSVNPETKVFTAPDVSSYFENDAEAIASSSSADEGAAPESFRAARHATPRDPERRRVERLQFPPDATATVTAVDAMPAWTRMMSLDIIIIHRTEKAEKSFDF
jgi:hypothetical protein